MTEILSVVADGVATVTLNRPERRNALTVSVAAELDSTLRAVDADAEVRCIVLTGAGSAFCSGDDTAQWGTPAMDDVLAEFAAGDPKIPAPLGALVDAVTPVLAAVNGPAFGAGMDLAMLADVRLASTQASFAQPYVKYGLTPHIGGFWRLPQLVGPALAAELLFTARTMTAAEALACGLVSRVTEPESLLDTAMSMAMTIAGHPPAAVQGVKQGLRRGINAASGDLGELAAWASHTLADRFAEVFAQTTEA